MADTLREKLQQGIQAARDGDRVTGRRLLRQVVQEDPYNEVAWIWLATCAQDLQERRAALEQVLDINPNNARARQALSQLSPQARAQANNAAAEQTSASGGGNAGRLILLVAVLILVTGGTFLLVDNLSLFDGGDGDTTTAGGTTGDGNTGGAAVGIIASITPIPTITPTFTITPTREPVFFDGTSGAPTLPPTFTPTPTPEPTSTATPTVTPVPLVEFEALYTSLEQGETQPDLYRIAGDGTEEQLIAMGARDIVYDLAGENVLFVRDVSYIGEQPLDGTTEGAEPPPVIDLSGADSTTDENTPDAEATEAVETLPFVSPPGTLPETDVTLGGTISPELFIASVNNIEDARQLTRIRGDYLGSPTWSPEGDEIIFVSDFGGSDNLWYITPDGENLRQITGTQDITERDPAWEPVLGSRRILFAADTNSFGSLEIYSMELTEPGVEPVVTQLTNAGGSSYAPQWSHDGSQIAFVSDRSGDPDVYVMSPDGASELVVTIDDGGAEDRNPAFTPDGRFVAFISNREDDRFQTYLASLDGTVLVRLTNHNRNDTSIDYQPELLLRIRN